MNQPKPNAAEMPLTPTGIERQYPCGQCGAKLEFVPGSTVLKCPYCAFENQVSPMGDTLVEEVDYEATIASLESGAPVQEQLLVKCGACAADVTPPPNVTAFACPYCGTSIVAATHSVKHIKPTAVLPFAIKREQSREMFRRWISSRWFAPSKLKHYGGIDEGIVGLYLPAWTHDADTTTAYTGARGDYYYTNESYTTTINGKRTTQTRRVRHTRWSSAAGSVNNAFDDLLVVASRSLPDPMVKRLEPWDLKALVPYSDDYLAGFRAESYQIDLPASFDLAKGMMQPVIRSTISSHIGGDEQRIDSIRVQYSNITFKHILLPVWISAYRFRDKTYRFVVNARTGEVQGDRPYSPWKIASLVLAIVGVIAIIAIVAATR